MLQWARANGCPWNEFTTSAALYGGHLEVLQWARANGCPWTASTRKTAVDLGYIESDRSLSDESDEDEDGTSK